MNELLAYSFACLSAVSAAVLIYVVLWIIGVFEATDKEQSYKDKP